MKTTDSCKNESIRLKQPECSKDCWDIDCRKCVYYKYANTLDPCPFQQYLNDYPVEKPTDTDKRSGLFCRKGTHGLLFRLAEKKELKTLDKVEDLLTEINQNIIKLGEVEHEQPAPKYRKVCPVGIQFACAQCQSKEEDSVEYEVVEPGQVGDLCNLPFMPNANESEFGKDFYHYCTKRNRSLVQLFYDEDKDEHICPLCNEVYLPKQYDPRSCVSKSK